MTSLNSPVVYCLRLVARNESRVFLAGAFMHLPLVSDMIFSIVILNIQMSFNHSLDGGNSLCFATNAEPKSGDIVLQSDNGMHCSLFMQ